MEISYASYEVEKSLKRAIVHVEEFHRSGHLHLLLYAALDTRICIERTLFEYLVLTKTGNIPAKLERLYSAKDLKKAILREEPKFYEKVRFMNLFARFLPYPNAVVVTPDLDKLSESYGRTNNYLHSPKRPEETWEKQEWWAVLEESLKSVIPHLVQIHSGLMSGMNMNERGEELFGKFVAGDMSESDVLAELEKTFKSSPPR
ncbi:MULTISPECIES: hypothetical protein [Microbulbifer]|uniref:hypothetical protein n=1 Tax=Microbulbifer TaxID=48073 RepID=UPI001F2C07E6|nr:hypothetical protein [Microbulbifer zhoushanensis]